MRLILIKSSRFHIIIFFPSTQKFTHWLSPPATKLFELICVYTNLELLACVIASNDELNKHFVKHISWGMKVYQSHLCSIFLFSHCFPKLAFEIRRQIAGKQHSIGHTLHYICLHNNSILGCRICRRRKRENLINRLAQNSDFTQFDVVIYI